MFSVSGFLKHVGEVETFYCKRRDAMVKAAEKHLSNICTWSVPEGGMFLWMNAPGIEDTHQLIYEKAAAKNVLLIPGTFFVPGGGGTQRGGGTTPVQLLHSPPGLGHWDGRQPTTYHSAEYPRSLAEIRMVLQTTQVPQIG